MSLENTHQSSLISLLNKIDMPGEVIDDIVLCNKTGVESLPGIKNLMSHMNLALKNRDNGVWKVFPEKIFIDTMGCFSRFVKEYHVSYGYYGFDRAFWTTRQAEAKLFRIGELEYEFEDGDNTYIHLHIPSDANFNPNLLNASVSDAGKFIADYFPEKADMIYKLESWILSPALSELLGPESRIMRFQQAFDITWNDPEAMDCLEWVFNIAGGQIASASLEKLPENTSLQKKMKKVLLQGGHIGNAEGILKRNFI